MRSVLLRFFKYQSLGSADCRELESYVFQTTFLQEECVKWINSSHEEYIDNVVDGHDISGRSMRVELKIPDALLHPPPFTKSDWLVNPSKTMYDAQRKYNYMINRSYLSIKNYKDQDSIEWKTMNDLFVNEQLQTRFRTIWHELQAVLFAVDMYLGHAHHPLRYVVKHLILIDGRLPFMEKAGKVYVDESSTHDFSTLLPMICYMLMSVGTDICIGTVTEAESAMIINHYLELATDDYCDEKLRIKSAMRDWFGEALSNLKTIKYPKYNLLMEVAGNGVIQGIEPKIVRDLHVKVREDREKKLKKYPVVRKYIDDSFKSTSIEEVIDRLLVCNALSNDRTYYKTHTELSLDAAVKSVTTQHIISRPDDLLVSDGDHYSYLKEFKELKEPALFWAQTYLNLFTDKLKANVSTLDLDQEWLHFLTTSSPGQKLDEEIQQKLQKEIGVLFKTRIGLEAFQAESYRSMERILKSLQEPIMLVQRQQIDRRQRAIAGLNNARVMLSFTAYVIIKFMYRLSDDAAQGKQVGNALDLKDLLIATTQKKCLVSSIDIKGFDASVQPILKELINNMCQRVAMNSNHTMIGPFMDTEINLIHIERGEKVLTRVSGLWNALTFEVNNAQTSTTYNSRYFGAVRNTEGTFPSGRADTSSHHTIVLSSLQRGNEMRRRVDANSIYNASALVFGKSMGDDKSDLYYGEYNNMVDHILSDRNTFKNAGFETTSDLSSHSGEFLQQHCARGRYVPKPSRISIFTVEHVKEKRHLHDACSELLSIMDDMMSRARDLRGLKLLVFSTAIHCINRIVLNVRRTDLAQIEPKMKSNGIRYHIYTKTNPQSDSHNDYVLVGIYVPIMWYFMYRGGELPAYPIQRADGSYTEDESLYSPRGECKRRLIFDIIGIENYFLDKGDIHSVTRKFRDHLDVMGINAADAIIKMKITDIKEEIRAEKLPSDQIRALAENLQQYGDKRKYDRSLHAYLKIDQELNKQSLLLDKEGEIEIVGRMKSRIPKSIVYVYELEAKLEQVIIAKEVDLSEVPVMSKRLVDHFRSLRPHHEFETYARDILHIHAFMDSNHPLVYRQSIMYLDGIRLNQNMYEGSLTLKLYHLLGTINSEKSENIQEINWLRGKYGNFKIDDERMKYGYEVIWRKHRHLISDYYDMIGASERMRALLTKAYQYADQEGTVQYNYIQPSRNNFFISDDPMSCADNIIYVPSGNKMLNAVMLIFGYLHFLKYADVINSRQRLVLHPSIFEYMDKRYKQLGVRLAVSGESGLGIL
uniref:RdRp n=1 Tax=Hubei reo-like virus 9 TaxID=1923184 RepID=A0A1L3KP48_9VIRU|nr:RdRp [Hubei reo-like virus 9]